MNIITLMAAAEQGDTHSVALYVQSCDEQTRREALEAAVQNNHADCVALLVPKCSWSSVSEVINELIRNHCVSEVMCVLEYVEDIRVFNGALGMAAVCNQQECLNILYPLADVPEVLKSLREQYYGYSFNGLHEMYTAEQQKNRLQQAIEHDVLTQRRSSKM